MITNKVFIPPNKLFIKPFIETVLKKETKQHIAWAKKFYTILKLLITIPPRDWSPLEDKNKKGISFQLPKWKDIDTHYNFYFSDVRQKEIIRWIYNLFYAIFEAHMLECRKMNMTNKNGVYLFIEIYNLNIYVYDTLIKHDQRFREKLIPKKTKKISSHFSSISSNRGLLNYYF